MKIPINDFRSFLENRNLKERTVSEYIYYCLRFLPYKRFTQENINRFTSKKGNMSPSSRGFLKNLKKFLMLNHKELGISQEDRMEIAEVELPTVSGRPKVRLINPLTENHILEIEKYLESEKDKLKLLMSFYAGLRTGELHKIKIVSFNWDEWKQDMNQVCECRVYGKGDKEGIAFFPPILMKRIAKYISTQSYPSLSSYLFMKGVDSKVGGNIQGKTHNWQIKVKRAAIKAGIVKFDDNGKIIPETNVSPHRLRHSWGYHLKNVKNMDIRDIQEILRHSSIRSTEIYTRIDKSVLKEKLSKNIFGLVK